MTGPAKEDICMLGTHLVRMTFTLHLTEMADVDDEGEMVSC